MDFFRHIFLQNGRFFSILGNWRNLQTKWIKQGKVTEIFGKNAIHLICCFLVSLYYVQNGRQKT